MHAAEFEVGLGLALGCSQIKPSDGLRVVLLDALAKEIHLPHQRLGLGITLVSDLAPFGYRCGVVLALVGGIALLPRPGADQPGCEQQQCEQGGGESGHLAWGSGLSFDHEQQCTGWNKF